MLSSSATPVAVLAALSSCCGRASFAECALRSTSSIRSTAASIAAAPHDDGRAEPRAKRAPSRESESWRQEGRTTNSTANSDEAHRELSPLLTHASLHASPAAARPPSRSSSPTSLADTRDKRPLHSGTAMAAPANAASAAASAAAAAAAAAADDDAVGPSNFDLPALTSTPNVADMSLTQGDDGAGGDKAAGTAGGESEEGNMVDVLRRVWIAEKAVPELLKYEDAIVADVKAALDDRQRELTHFKTNPQMQFLCTVLQMEADRIHFMLVSYHRIRLKKIERFAAHLVFSGEGERRCSQPELTFLNGYIDLLNSHLHTSFLGQLPSRMQKWIDPANPHKEPGVIESPDRDNTFVIFKVKENIEQFVISENEVESLAVGDIMAGNWKVYYTLFTEGLIELM